ncbi:3-phosphoserine/phosphohydroxythreonine transaminase [Rubrivirga sp.]|uniref:3-phosphoserine/phosphohydroxythreonine transaminase n=1 Tax=Rubrivirga sp. TaxID=1885344 RepID=UPI003C7435C0
MTMISDSPSADLDVRQHNFSAGPGALPTEVLEEVRDEMPAFPGLGASIVEVSHRSAAYTEIFDRAKSRMRSLLGLGDDWHVLFLQSGASLQFHQVPLNFLEDGGTAAYLDTGTWSAKAIKEAQVVARGRRARVAVAASSAEADYSFIPTPRGWSVPADASYLHYTSNNTIVGTQFHDEPIVDMPLVCDMSSDFLSRPIEAERYGLIYAGAQKNLGPAGATVVLVHDDFLKTRQDGLPTLLDYQTHAAKLFHTPPVFVVYVIDKVLGWIERHGGLSGMVERNRAKVDRLYGALDASGFYRGTARADSRSHMNVTFRLPSSDLEDAFIKGAAHEGLLALKGHRSVGGVRASIYNAVEPSSVEALVDYMRRFEAESG